MNNTSDKKTINILFYAERSLHLQYLEPIHDYLKNTYPDLKLCFSAPPFVPTTKTMPGVGLPEKEINRIKEKTAFFSDSSHIQADLAVIADPCHLRIPHISRVVNVGHGLASKGLYFCRNNIIRRENLSEMMCVPGPWHKRILEENVFIPIKVTGYIKSDMLFGPDAVNKTEFCNQLNMDPEKQFILFAPTFNEELSSIPDIKDKISEFAGPDTYVMVKLHPMTDPLWVNMYKKLAKDNDHIVFLEDADYSGMMHAADVMISDVSSMFIEFMILNKPVVLYKNPKTEEYSEYDPNNIEYIIRKAVQEAYSFTQLQEEVEIALQNPQMLSRHRKKYIKELDYGQDGKSAIRAGEAIYSSITNYNNNTIKNKNCYSIFLLLDENDDKHTVEETVRQISENSVNHFIEYFFVSISGYETEALESQNPFIESYAHKIMTFPKALTMAKGNMSVIIKPGWNFPYNWLKWLHNHLLWNKNAGIVKAVQDINLIQSAFKKVIYDARPPVLCKSVSAALLNLCIGSVSINDNLDSSCAMLPLPVLIASIEAAPEILQGNIIKNLDIFFTNAGLLSLTALDTLVYPMNQRFFIWDRQALMEAASILKKEGLIKEAVELMERNQATVQPFA